MNKYGIRRAFGGGGKRLESSLQRGEEVEEVTKLLRHYGTKVVSGIKDDRTIRRKDDKFETEKVVLVDSSDEHESIVGWAFQPNNEKSIQSHPSPEFLNSLSFIKKFYPLPFGAREKFTKGTHEIAAISRHSERLAKESSNTNLIQLQGIKINSAETDQASMPLGIFASKSVSCRHSNADLHLAASLPSRLAAKKVAFTLAEVLITLGIIGVVAAVTLPTLVANY